MERLVLLLFMSTSLTVSYAQEADSIVDIRDGQVYKVVKLGKQWWMQENLNIGTSITGGNNQSDNGVIEKYCYQNNESNCDVYGGLYCWDEMMDYNPSDTGNPRMTRGICPVDWHIPTDDEWKKLEKYLGMTQAEADLVNTWRGTGVGTMLGPGGNSGYEALYSGRISSSGSYVLLGDYEYIWTATEYGTYAWRRCLSKDANNVGRWNTFPKTYGFSVRCIRDPDQFSYLAILDKNLKPVSKLDFTIENVFDTMIIFNSSAGKTINITSLYTSTSEFAVNKSSSALLPGESLYLNITFNAFETGIHYSDTLHIESDDPFNPIISVPLTGYLEPVVAKICMVTVDTASGKNLIVWEKDPDAGTVYFNIYRKSSGEVQYNLIGTNSYNDLSIFSDTTSIPEVQEYFYKITAVDTCDHESAMSPYHKPLFLQYLSSSEGVNLRWNEYEVEGGLMNFESYEIYRGSDPGSLTKIDEISGSLNDYIDTDPSFQQKTCYYRLAGRTTKPCYPTLNKKSDIIYTRSFSNLEDNRLCSGCDVTPPSVPDGLQVSVERNTITLSWNSSDDAGGIESYNIYDGNFNKILVVYDTIHVFTGLEYDTTYFFMITAVDSSGNESGESNIISATTAETTGMTAFTVNQIKVCPNPFSFITTIRFINPEECSYTLHITDLSGKVCRIIDDINTSEYILEKGDLKKGFYFLELRGLKIYRGKIVIE